MPKANEQIATTGDPTASDDNRSRILRAAEQLMATRGIEGVSLREINRVAGQGNASAIQYHFGDREGLLIGVLERHQAQTDPHRHHLLDEYEAAGDGDVRALAAALVVPLVERLQDPDGGRDYLQIACEFYSRARSLDDLGRHRDPRHSMARWHRLVAERLPDQELRSIPPRFPAVRLVIGEVARRAQDRPKRSDALYAAELIDLVAALLDAPLSADTERLLRQRAEARRRR
jgi:AcrR family transcriptional regulator